MEENRLSSSLSRWDSPEVGGDNIFTADAMGHWREQGESYFRRVLVKKAHALDCLLPGARLPLLDAQEWPAA